MNKHSKATRISICLILLVSLSACSLGSMVTSSPDKVSRTAAKIADFDLPPGYKPDISISMLGYTLAAFNPGDEHSHLYLIQSEEESDREALEKGLKQIIPGTGDLTPRMSVVETRQIKLRGQDATLVISEGGNSENMDYRQVTAAFEGKGGPAMLVLTEPADRWDQARIDDFLASLH